MKKIIFSIVALLCLIIGFVQFRNINELVSSVFLSKAGIKPVIRMQDILPINHSDKMDVVVPPTVTVKTDQPSGEGNSKFPDSTNKVVKNHLTKDSRLEASSQSQLNGGLAKVSISTNNADISPFAVTPVTKPSKDLKAGSTSEDKTLTNSPNRFKLDDDSVNNQIALRKKETILMQKSVNENGKVNQLESIATKEVNVKRTSPSKELNTKSDKIYSDEKIGSSITMYASLLTPKSNDNTEIIKAYINDELLPNQQETGSELPKMESESALNNNFKIGHTDTINSRSPKVNDHITLAKPESNKNQVIETVGNTSGSESIMLPNISYTNIQKVVVGLEITPIVPSNSGSTIPATIYGHVSTIAGGGTNGDSGLKNGISLSARFYYPYSAVVDTKGNIYVADQGNSVIRKITSSGIVSTLAGSGSAGFADGFGIAASFSNPKGLAVDSAGNVYVADAVNNRIRKITSQGMVSTLAGNSTSGFVDGMGSQASFYNPSAIALDARGNLYVADEKNHAIRKITPSGEVNTLAGNGSLGSTNGIGAEASFNYPSGISLDGMGNVYVADFSNHKIRKITPDGLVTTIAGTGSIGRVNGIGKMASFHNPTGISVDKAGNIYIADAGNHLIRKINIQGIVSTLPCTESEGSISNLTTNTGFYNPSSVITDGKGSIYVTDQNNNRIRKIGVTGFTISPSLPSGLLFDSSSGIISGTPTIASDLTDYSITAYNSTGSSTTSITLATVSPPAATNGPNSTQ